MHDVYFIFVEDYAVLFLIKYDSCFFQMPVTIDDPTVYAAIKEAFEDIGLHPSDPSL